MDKKFRAQRIRRLVLTILHQARLTGQSESQGWLNSLMLRRILADQGYDLEDLELKDFLVWLSDKEKGCIEFGKIGQKPPYIYRSRITAKGVSVLLGEEEVTGIASE